MVKNNKEKLGYYIHDVDKLIYILLSIKSANRGSVDFGLISALPMGIIDELLHCIDKVQAGHEVGIVEFIKNVLERAKKGYPEFFDNDNCHRND